MPKVNKEQARYILWMRGELDWKLHSGQMVIEKAYRRVKRKLFVGNCARRFGKSYWLVKKAVEEALNNKLSLPRIKIASATAKNLEEFIIPAFQQILEDCPEEVWPGWSTGYVRSKKKFVFPNGAEIQLVGLDKDPDGLRGNYADLVIIDEAGMVDNLDYLYGSVIGPMTLLRKNSRIIVLSTPSATPEHPFKSFCERAQEQKAYVELNIHDNPMMTPELIAQARAECLTESDWLREYMCQHVTDLTRAVVPEWSTDYEKEIERPEYFKHLARYVSMDLGTKVDLTAVLYGWYDNVQRYLYIEDETEMTGPTMTTPRLVKQIKEREEELWPDLEVYRRVADNNNPLLVQDMGMLHDLYFMATGKDDLHAMINELRKMIIEGRIIVGPKAVKTRAALAAAIWDKERKKLSRSKALGHFDHLMALVYMVRNLDQNYDNVPKYNEKSRDIAFSRQRRKEEKAVHALVKTMMGVNKKR